MKKTVLLALILLQGFSPLLSQSYFYNDKYFDSPVTWELGLSIGGMNCLTDLGGKKGTGKQFIKDCNWGFTQFSFGFYGSFLYQYIIGGRLEVNFGKVKAADHILKQDRSVAQNRYERNLDFFSRITDLLVMAEFHPVTLFTGIIPAISPYLLSGVGAFRFDPRTMLDGKEVRLQPLHTEGQGFREYAYRKEYRLQQINFPVGIGLKYELSPIFNARLEILYRILLTDYLDDVSSLYINPESFSTYLDPSSASIARRLADRRFELNNTIQTKEGEKRGNPANNDTYFTIGCKIGVVLGRVRRN